MINVLFADDEVVMQMAFRSMLEKAGGFSLCAAVANGSEALAYVKSNPVDVVVTDLRMPTMDGARFIRALRSEGFGGAVLVLSNYSDFELVREALTSGADDYLLKANINGDILIEKLTALTAKHSAAPPELGRGERLRAWFAFEQGASAPDPFPLCRPCLIRLRGGEGKASAVSASSRAKTVFDQVFANADATVLTMGGTQLLMLVPVESLNAKGWGLDEKLTQAARQLRIYVDLVADTTIAPPTDSPETARQIYSICVGLPDCKQEVRDALLYIHMKYAEKITLDGIAHYVSLNSSYLCRLFKAEIGVSMFTYINDLRMIKAAELASSGRGYMRDVAALVGIDDPLYFSRMFKKHYGMSPSEYGKRHGEK